MAYWLDRNSAITVSNQLQKKGNKIVLTHGTFDLFHIGHLAFLRKAKRQGDILVVGVDSDDWVRLLKGSKRPVMTADERIGVISGLQEVDFVFETGQKKSEIDNYYLEFYEKMNPGAIVFGRNFIHKDKVIKRLARNIAQRVHYLTTPFNTPSTSEIIERVITAHKNP